VDRVEGEEKRATVGITDCFVIAGRGNQKNNPKDMDI
jgi:hypothetical protein